MKLNKERAGGIIMPISSLPSKYGIGTFGHTAYKYADFLSAAGQRYWQMLPLGPVNDWNSPYQCRSSGAGNPYYIDLDLLVEDGLLTPEEVGQQTQNNDPRHVDYCSVQHNRSVLLAQAAERGIKRDRSKLERFIEENNEWLPDYALFTALEQRYGTSYWTKWPDWDLRQHHSEALCLAHKELTREIELIYYIQFLFYRQWDALKNYINGLGIEVIGDLPMYVPINSADVWSDRDMFLLDANGFPVEVSGAPPDGFCSEGQVWNTPLYDYESMRRDGFAWWMRRVKSAVKLYDVIRLDNFHGYASYYAIPNGSGALSGHWVKGPGMDLVGAVINHFSDTDFIADDLGESTAELRCLLDDSGIPGMRVLVSAFGSGSSNPFLPHQYPVNCVCYTSTHDDPPLALWFETAEENELSYAEQYFAGERNNDFQWNIIRGGMSSVARIFMVQMQDYLGLGKGCRMNTPGVADGCWTWRMLPDEIDMGLAEKIAEMTRCYGRSVC